MSKLGQFAESILVRGLPSTLDTLSSSLKGGDTKPEQTPPSPKVEDRDTSSPVKPVSVLDHMGAKEWVIGGVGLVVAGVLLYFAFKGVRK